MAKQISISLQNQSFHENIPFTVRVHVILVSHTPRPLGVGSPSPLTVLMTKNTFNTYAYRYVHYIYKNGIVKMYTKKK